MRWLLLGYGDLSEKRVAAALRQAAGSELVAVWGRDAAKCREFAGRHDIGIVFAGADGLNDALKEDVDAVYVCTPVDTHCEYSIRAMTAGKHVLCEKPMAIDVGECRRMIDCADERNVQLAVAYYRRFFANLVRIKELIDGDALGQILYVNMVFQQYYCPGEGDQDYWRVQPKRAGGGVSYDVGSHRLDLLSYWFGNVNLKHAQKLNLIHSYAVEDTATFLMGLSDFKDAPAVLNVSWGCRNGIDRMAIVGSAMSIVADALGGPDIRLIKRGGETVERFNNADNVHIPLVEDFVRSVEVNRPAVCSGQEGMKTNVLLEAVR